MFVKLIVLIMALGSTGVGVLSVRQSRLVASNEMTQSRLRSRELSQRAMELRAQIAQRISPDQLNLMLDEDLDRLMVDETLRRIDLIDQSEPVVYIRPDASAQTSWTQQIPLEQPAAEQDLIAQSTSVVVNQEPTEPQETQAIQEPEYWTLDDGTRVYLIDPNKDD